MFNFKKIKTLIHKFQCILYVFYYSIKPGEKYTIEKTDNHLLKKGKNAYLLKLKVFGAKKQSRNERRFRKLYSGGVYSIRINDIKIKTDDFFKYTYVRTITHFSYKKGIKNFCIKPNIIDGRICEDYIFENYINDKKILEYIKNINEWHEYQPYVTGNLKEQNDITDRIRLLAREETGFEDSKKTKGKLNDMANSIISETNKIKNNEYIIYQDEGSLDKISIVDKKIRWYSYNIWLGDFGYKEDDFKIENGEVLLKTVTEYSKTVEKDEINYHILEGKVCKEDIKRQYLLDYQFMLNFYSGLIERHKVEYKEVENFIIEYVNIS